MRLSPWHEAAPAPTVQVGPTAVMPQANVAFVTYTRIDVGPFARFGTRTTESSFGLHA